MGKYKVVKLLYALVHIIAPVSYLAVSIIWGHFFTSKAVWENVTDNLGILAIWYIGISVFWFFSADYINNQADKVSNEMKSKGGAG